MSFYTTIGVMMSSSLDNVRILDALGADHWQNQLSFRNDLNTADTDWHKADVWHDEGMWLHGTTLDGIAVIVYFQHMNCGESSEATYATMNVLRSAGFTLSTADIRNLETRSHSAFTKE